MQYKTICEKPVSCLGMGNMRLPILQGKTNADIDYEKAQAIIDAGMANGINYYDTAYVYHSGNSERFLGEALVSRYERSSFQLATKFLISANPDYEAVFEEQLKKLQTDYIDFYLIHAVTDANYRQYMESGCIAYFAEQKRKGRIRQLGFSSHSSPEVLQQFADCHEWDFVQVQLNYFDWIHGSAKKEYEILAAKKLPIVVMEPLRGGRLASLTEETEQMLKEVHPEWSIASWAFRFLKRLPQVHVVLSGMSAADQMADNLHTFSDEIALTDEEEKLLLRVAELFRNTVRVPCTSCRYCCDGCPAKINIPVILALYNRARIDGAWVLNQLKELDSEGKVTDCIGCAACESHCPQNIGISSIMQELAAR